MLDSEPYGTWVSLRSNCNAVNILCSDKVDMLIDLSIWQAAELPVRRRMSPLRFGLLEAAPLDAWPLRPVAHPGSGAKP